MWMLVVVLVVLVFVAWLSYKIGYVVGYAENIDFTVLEERLKKSKQGLEALKNKLEVPHA